MSDVARESGRRAWFGSWFKSSFSADDGCCVEVLFSDQLIRLRDSKYQRRGQNALDEPFLSYTPAEWDTFIRGVKAGEFDI